MSRRLALIVNPAAGGGRAPRAARAAAAELERRGATFRVVESASPEHARRAAAEAAQGGETVVAVGGDGMIGVLAGALRDTGAGLALVPAGRGNDLARVLGVPLDPAAAAGLAVDGGERLIDVGEVHGTSFLGIASFGFDSAATRIANASRVPGKLVYVYAGLRALASWRDAAFEVSVDGRDHRLTGYTVAVANSGAYAGGVKLAPHAELDDGRLDLVMIAAQPKARFALQIPRAFRGAHVDDPTIRFDRGEVIELRADRPFTLYADGDPVGETPATVRVAPRCLRVIAPRAA